MATKQVGLKFNAGELEELDVNMTPMIDAVFLLLMFFLIVSKLTESTLEALVIPYATYAVPDKASSNRIVVNITPKGHIKIMGQRYTMKELAFFIEGEVRRLDGGIQKAMDQGGSRLSVLIRLDSQTQYYHMQEVIRVMSVKGVLKIEIAARKKHGDS